MEVYLSGFRCNFEPYYKHMVEYIKEFLNYVQMPKIYLHKFSSLLFQFHSKEETETMLEIRPFFLQLQTTVITEMD